MDETTAVLSELAWVAVPAGTVVMGTDETEIDDVMAGYDDLPIEHGWILKECPTRRIPLPAFWICRVPVTNAVFARAAGTARPQWRPAGPPDHPALVSWAEARWFCEWLAAGTGLAVGLPTEQQWERAARGDDRREFPWGSTFDDSRANTRENGPGTTTPVGAYPAGAGPFGTLDMAGNAEEWTATEYGPYPGAPDGVPAVEDWARDRHVSRGGSYAHDRDLARCARRHTAYSSEPTIGFRPVVTT